MTSAGQLTLSMTGAKEHRAGLRAASQRLAELEVIKKQTSRLEAITKTADDLEQFISATLDDGDESSEAPGLLRKVRQLQQLMTQDA